MDMLVMEKLDELIKLQKTGIVLLDKIFKLFNQYNTSYLEEVEKDNIVDINP